MTDILDEEADLIERVRTLERQRDAEAADRAELKQQLASLIEGRKTQRWILAFVVPALITALGTVFVWSSGRIEASAERVGETAAELRGLKERAANQALDIAQLREQLWSLGRRSSASPSSPPPTSDVLVPPDRYSSYGGSNPQWPKLHAPHPACGKIWHSGRLLQMSPHRSGWRSNSRNLAASIDSLSSTWPGPLCSPGTGAQPATAIAITRFLHIPEM